MLDQDRKDRLLELFAEGVQLGADERRDFVVRSCGDDGELRAELSELLEVQQAGLAGFLDEPAVARPSTLATAFDGVAEPAAAAVPRIAGYSDFVLVGQGGMGSVYRAMQREPVKRQVAIKVIRAGMDSGTVLQRFEAERQALARMAHPYIATVHDAGKDEFGRPFLAMEYVDGLPINDYCQREELALRERLQLFAKVCDAVDHAHRRGVLHRDLKPSNVLVATVGDTSMPKIIDFGIAKAMEGGLTENTLLTEQGAFLGTPEYMGPEQLVGDGRSVDTRTDVYALGAMLYELLTGSMPFPSERLRAAGLARMATILRDEVPPKPSTRARNLVTREAAVGTQQTGWIRRLDGDLDWVVMKAIDKDPEQRYQSPRALGEDLRRYLDNRPVLAGPPSGLYRLRRFARRYRIQVAAGVLVLLSLVIGLFGTLWFLFEANDRAGEARARARQATGSRIAAEAALVTEDDPNLTMLLALEASRFAGPATVANAVFGALPSHDLVASMRLGDHDAREVQFLSDGRLLVRTFDSHLSLLDEHCSALLRRFIGHTDLIQGMSVAAAEGLVATASRDCSVRVWRIDDGAQLEVLPHPGSVREVRYSPGDRFLATRHDPGIVRIYECGSWSLRHEFGGAGRAWESLDFTPDGRCILLHGADGRCEIRDLADGSLRGAFQASPARRGAEVRFGPGGQRVIRQLPARRDKQRALQVWSTTGELLQDLVGFSGLSGPTTEPLFASGPERLVELSLATGEVRQVAPYAGGYVLARSPDGAVLVAVDRQEDLCLLDARTGKAIRDLAGPSDKRSNYLDVSFHPDGRRFAVTGSSVRVWQLRPEFAPVELLATDEKWSDIEIDSLACGAEAAFALVRRHPAGKAREWQLWNLDDRRVVRTLRPAGVDRLVLSANTDALIGVGGIAGAAAVPTSSRVVVLDPAGELLHQRELPVDPGMVWPRADGSGVVFVSEREANRRQVDWVDFASGASRSRFWVDNSVFHLGQVSAPSYAITSFGSRSRTEIFELQTGRRVRDFAGPKGAGHYAQAVDEHARRVLIALGDRRVRAFSLDGDSPTPTGEYARIVRSDSYHTGFIPNTDLAWASCANEVHVFHAVTCEPFAVLRLATRVAGVAARPDGSELWTVTRRGTCQRWPLDPVAAARRLAVGSLDRRTLTLFDIGTESERVERERAQLLARPSPRNWALLGEIALGEGDLDEAITCYRRGCDLWPLPRDDRRRYVRLLELLGMRLRRAADSAATGRDVESALAVLRQCHRCDTPIAELEQMRSIDELRRHPRLRELLTR